MLVFYTDVCTQGDHSGAKSCVVEDRPGKSCLELNSFSQFMLYSSVCHLRVCGRMICCLPQAGAVMKVNPDGEPCASAWLGLVGPSHTFQASEKIC